MLTNDTRASLFGTSFQVKGGGQSSALLLTLGGAFRLNDAISLDLGAVKSRCKAAAQAVTAAQWAGLA